MLVAKVLQERVASVVGDELLQAGELTPLGRVIGAEAGAEAEEGVYAGLVEHGAGERVALEEAVARVHDEDPRLLRVRGEPALVLLVPDERERPRPARLACERCSFSQLSQTFKKTEKNYDRFCCHP